MASVHENNPVANWPALPLAEWRDTYSALHRQMQIVGKVRLALTPLVNHHWNVAFHLTARGLTARPMPYVHAGTGQLESVEVRFDFLDHNVVVSTSRNEVRALALIDRTVSDFYREFMTILETLGVRVHIDDRPVEIPNERLPFHDDRLHSAYDAESVSRWFHILRRSATIFEEFRARFVGKCSPVHFFWGSFDLAVSRFSGRRTPEREAEVTPGGNKESRFVHEAYSHEVSSAGFWPGDVRYPQPAFYSYFVPAPSSFQNSRITPDTARYHPDLGEFLLPYDDFRHTTDPRSTLRSFLQSTYEAGANLAGWNRAELERGVVEAVTEEERASPTSPTMH